jgi:hypothetical protein
MAAEQAVEAPLHPLAEQPSQACGKGSVRCKRIAFKFLHVWEHDNSICAFEASDVVGDISALLWIFLSEKPKIKMR